MQLRVVSMSKHLAKYVRHAPHEPGLTLQPGRWLSVDNLLAAEKKGFPITSDELVDCNARLALSRKESP
jgi:putative RNA 2'-phosphotransferase